ncbi:MAG: DEAD/DEAH box helicase, partial [Acidimicrobiales bacterium]
MDNTDITDITEPQAEADELTFEDLGVSPRLVKVLADQGITEPFAIQRLSIADALAGRDVCGKAKTGSGKTLAFGLPMLERLEPAEPRRPRGLVLVPTRELALQVHDVLAPLAKAIGSRIVAVYGGADMNRQIKRLTEGVEAIIATPGRLIDLVDRKEVELGGLELVVVDEADRMADMGFLPQVEWLLRHVDNRHQTLLFSATLDGVVDGLIKRYQHDPVYHEVASPTV